MGGTRSALNLPERVSTKVMDIGPFSALNEGSELIGLLHYKLLCIVGFQEICARDLRRFVKSGFFAHFSFYIYGDSVKLFQVSSYGKGSDRVRAARFHTLS